MTHTSFYHINQLLNCVSDLTRQHFLLCTHAYHYQSIFIFSSTHLSKLRSNKIKWTPLIENIPILRQIIVVISGARGGSAASANRRPWAEHQRRRRTQTAHSHLAHLPRASRGPHRAALRRRRNHQRYALKTTSLTSFLKAPFYHLIKLRNRKTRASVFFFCSQRPGNVRANARPGGQHS